MKHLSRAFIAIILAVITATLLPLQVFAEAPEYISEIKVYEGSYKDAEKEGYTLLNGDNGKPVDLNADAGATGTGAKGNKAVYLGYKTTRDRKEAITDLALMNMKGGYDVAEYEKLMEAQMKEQIIPFVDTFLSAIKEYRENYNSKITNNKQRAQHIHDMLNKLTDDDCGGKGLGDLLLNETKYEMGDEAYSKLSDEDKKNHADILTIIAQANGQATLLLENLLTRATDTNDDTWLDRFAVTTYDDLLELSGGSPSEARKKLARAYDDDAQIVFEAISELREDLEGYDSAEEIIEKADYEALMNTINAFYELDENASAEEASEAYEAYIAAENEIIEYYNAMETVAIYTYLENTDYEDGTLLDFFSMSDEDFEDDISMLYPIVASLTEGQRAGLEFVSLKELMVMALTENESYNEYKLRSMEAVSIYDGVDRGIYQKGGVALTSDALRADAMSKIQEENDKGGLSKMTIAFIVIASVSAVSFITSAGIAAKFFKNASHFRRNLETIEAFGTDATFGDFRLGKFFNNPKYGVQLEYSEGRLLNSRATNVCASRARFSTALSTGFCVAMVVFTALSIYFSYQDMKAKYKVDFTPIPHYMIDEKDLVGYNSKGEKVVLKNQSAYYKAVQCNRKKGDSYFDDIDTCADMNGCVGKQWLALYAAKNELMTPILADSLKVVVGSTEIPTGYETGIHMFGENAAFNLNSSLYCWNSKAKSIMVYFKTDEDASSSTTASNFSGGTLAISAGGGLILGAAATALGMTATKKRKETAEHSA